MIKNKKYSILIPTRNGIKYLPYCINSVINQDYENYELIISDNHSIDGTWEYLTNLNNNKIIVIRPQLPLSMTDHWEWLLSHASGEWVMIVGDDDGLQPYFFKLADYLVKKAYKKNIRIINSKEASFLWRGCEDVYGTKMVRYNAYPSCKVKCGKYESILTLLGFKQYYALPKMYTISLFKKDLIADVRKIQDGRFYTSVIPDANSAAIAVNLEKQYLHTEIPLGWTGASPKSNGLSSSIHFGTLAANKTKEDETQRAVDFLALNSKSTTKWNELAGDIGLLSSPLFFWESLLQTQKVQSEFMKKLYNSKFLKTFMFSAALDEIYRSKDINNTKTNRTNKLFEAILLNNCSSVAVVNCRCILSFFYLIHKILKKIKAIKRRFQLSLICNVEFKNDVDLNITDASKLIEKLEAEHGIIRKFISKPI